MISIFYLWCHLLTYIYQFPTYDLIFWLIFLNFSLMISSFDLYFSISHLWSQLLTYVSQFPTYDLIFWLIFLNFLLMISSFDLYFSISHLWSHLLTYISQFPTYDLNFWLIFFIFPLIISTFDLYFFYSWLIIWIDVGHFMWHFHIYKWRVLYKKSLFCLFFVNEFMCMKMSCIVHRSSGTLAGSDPGVQTFHWESQWKV